MKDFFHKEHHKMLSPFEMSTSSASHGCKVMSLSLFHHMVRPVVHGSLWHTLSTSYVNKEG